MTSKLYSILLLLIFTITAQAQEYHVETPGTLQEVIGPGAEELTRIRVTGTLNDKDIAFLHYLCWPGVLKPTGMKVEKFLKIMQEKEDDFKTNLRHLDLEDARMVNDALPDKAFYFSYIKDYKLPKTLKKIGKGAFSYNVLLKELIIPESVEEIGKNLLFYSIEIRKVKLPEKLKVLNELLFGNCIKLEEVNIPSEVREIYSGVFYGCLKAPASIAVLPETVEILDGDIYYGVPSIECVTVPSKVRILNETYWAVPNLRKAIILTDKLDRIGNLAFYGCAKLEEVNIPDGVTQIGEGAFCWNLKLHKINIPSSVTRIEGSAFDSAPLDSIDIPAGVTFIGRNAFWNNRNLKKFIPVRLLLLKQMNLLLFLRIYHFSILQTKPSSMFPKAQPMPTVPLRCFRSSRRLLSWRLGNGRLPSVRQPCRPMHTKCTERLARCISRQQAVPKNLHSSMYIASMDRLFGKAR